MKTIWGFLENFYAGVYVADMNTYELIYMNAKAREWFQISDPEEYAGKKCYAVLQKFRMPLELPDFYRILRSKDNKLTQS